MDSVKVVKLGSTLMITGGDRVAVETAASTLALRGAEVLASPELMGNGIWIATCSDPSDREECEVIRLGYQVMLKASTEAAVRAKVEALLREGATLIAAPAEATGGGWVAVCDEAG